jgi:CTD nuclear envelope phosphatase 1
MDILWDAGDPVVYDELLANGIPIEGWLNDPLDEGLLELLPILDSLRFTKDVRRILGLKAFSMEPEPL